MTDPLAGQPTVINVPVSITNPLVLPGTQVDAQNGMFAYGWTLGLGVDFCLMQNLFLRAEWEWVQFAPIKDMNVHTNTVRAAVASANSEARGAFDPRHFIDGPSQRCLTA